MPTPWNWLNRLAAAEASDSRDWTALRAELRLTPEVICWVPNYRAAKEPRAAVHCCHWRAQDEPTIRYASATRTQVRPLLHLGETETDRLRLPAIGLFVYTDSSRDLWDYICGFYRSAGTSRLDGDVAMYMWSNHLHHEPGRFGCKHILLTVNEVIPLALSGQGDAGAWAAVLLRLRAEYENIPGSDDEEHLVLLMNPNLAGDHASAGQLLQAWGVRIGYLVVDKGSSCDSDELVGIAQPAWVISQSGGAFDGYRPRSIRRESGWDVTLHEQRVLAADFALV